MYLSQLVVISHHHICKTDTMHSPASMTALFIIRVSQSDVQNWSWNHGHWSWTYYRQYLHINPTDDFGQRDQLGVFTVFQIKLKSACLLNSNSGMAADMEHLASVTCN